MTGAAYRGGVLRASPTPLMQIKGLYPDLPQQTLLRLRLLPALLSPYNRIAHWREKRTVGLSIVRRAGPVFVFLNPSDIRSGFHLKSYFFNSKLKQICRPRPVIFYLLQSMVSPSCCFIH